MHSPRDDEAADYEEDFSAASSRSAATSPRPAGEPQPQPQPQSHPTTPAVASGDDDARTLHAAPPRSATQRQLPPEPRLALLAAPALLISRLARRARAASATDDSRLALEQLALAFHVGLSRPAAIGRPLLGRLVTRAGPLPPLLPDDVNADGPTLLDDEQLRRLVATTDADDESPASADAADALFRQRRAALLARPVPPRPVGCAPADSDAPLRGGVEIGGCESGGEGRSSTLAVASARLATQLLRNKLGDVRLVSPHQPQQPQVPAHPIPPLTAIMSRRVPHGPGARRSGSAGFSSARLRRQYEDGPDAGDNVPLTEAEADAPADYNAEPATAGLAAFNRATTARGGPGVAAFASGHAPGLAPPTLFAPPGFSPALRAPSHAWWGEAPSLPSSPLGALLSSQPWPMAMPVVVGVDAVSAPPRTMFLWPYPPPGCRPSPAAPLPSSSSLPGLPSQPQLSDDVLLRLFLLSFVRGESAADKQAARERHTAARAAGLIVPPLPQPLSLAGARGFSQALTSAQALQLLRHGSGAARAPVSATSASSAGPGPAVDAAPSSHVLAQFWGGAFDRLFEKVVLGLPRLVAEAALQCAAAPEPAPAEEASAETDSRDNAQPPARARSSDAGDGAASPRRGGGGQPAPLPLPLALAVAHPLLSALQDMLVDVDVLTLVREAVAARVQLRVAGTQEAKQPPQPPQPPVGPHVGPPQTQDNV